MPFPTKIDPVTGKEAPFRGYQRPVDENGKPIPVTHIIKNKTLYVIAPQEGVDFADSEAPIWDRQPTERPLWYERFVNFLKQGYSRSIARTYDECIKSTRGRSEGAGELLERTSGHRVPGHFRHYTRAWRWVERAQAWDIHMAEEEQRSWEAERLEARTARIKASKKLSQILADALENVDTETVTITLEDAANVLKIVNNELRMDYNDLPDTKVRLDSKVEADVQVSVQGAREALIRQLDKVSSRQSITPPTIQDLEPEAAAIEGEVRELEEDE